MKSYVIQWKKTVALSAILLMLSGCAWMNRLVYQVEINQGNYIETSAVEALRFSMTKQQVQYVLGPPMLINDGFPNTWYYTQWVKPSHEDPEQKTLIAYFDQTGKLERIGGDYTEGSRFFRPIGELE